MSSKIDPFKEGNNIFFKVPLELQKYMSSMSPSEITVYVFFMTQVFYQKSLTIEEPVDSICYWTGIKNQITVRNAIKGLVEKGWIGNILYQKNSSNKYVLNLEPKVNHELIKRMNERSKNTSLAKRKSIENGEKGKFEKRKDENLQN